MRTSQTVEAARGHLADGAELARHAPLLAARLGLEAGKGPPAVTSTSIRLWTENDAARVRREAFDAEVEAAAAHARA